MKSKIYFSLEELYFYIIYILHFKFYIFRLCDRRLWDLRLLFLFLRDLRLLLLRLLLLRLCLRVLRRPPEIKSSYEFINISPFLPKLLTTLYFL